MTCYAYDDKSKMCLIYGCDCDFEKWCFHTSKQEAMKINVVKDTERNNHDTEKRVLLESNQLKKIEKLFWNGKESK